MTAATEWVDSVLDDLRRLGGVTAFEHHETIDSTNDRGISLAKEVGTVGTVIVADAQTSGRGRRGASWHSGAGEGLWMSLILGEQDVLPQLPLLVGLACAEGIEALVDAVRVQVKWPNDLWLSGKKVGGVLCEVTDTGVVVGIGINLATAGRGLPPELSAIATTLKEESGVLVLRSELAVHILTRLRALLSTDAPFLAALAELGLRDALRGRLVHTEHFGEGRACGIEPSGALMLERSDGTRVSVISGSVRLA